MCIKICDESSVMQDSPLTDSFLVADCTSSPSIFAKSGRPFSTLTESNASMSPISVLSAEADRGSLRWRTSRPSCPMPRWIAALPRVMWMWIDTVNDGGASWSALQTGSSIQSMKSRGRTRNAFRWSLRERLTYTANRPNEYNLLARTLAFFGVPGPIRFSHTTI